MSTPWTEQTRYDGLNSISVSDASALYAGTYTATSTTACASIVFNPLLSFKGITGACVQGTSTGTSIGGVTLIKAVFPSSNTSGNSIIAAIAGNPNGASIVGVSCGDTQGNSYVSIPVVSLGGGYQTLNAFYATGIHAGTNTCTFTISTLFSSTALNGPVLSILEYPGVASLDVNTFANSASGGVITGTLTTHANNETLISLTSIFPGCPGSPVLSPISVSPTPQRGNIDYDQIRRSVRSGPGGTFAMITGTLTQGNGVVTDSLGDLIDGGAPFSSPLTTKGDLFTWGATNTRLPIGSRGQVLTVNTSATDGIDWEAPLVLTTSGTAGASSLTLGNPYTLNIPVYTTVAPAASITKYSQSWTSQTSVTVTHNLSTTNVLVQVWDGSSNYVIPQEITLTDANNVTLTFGVAFTGSVVVIGFGGVAASSQYTTSWTAQTSVTVTHNLGSSNVFVQVQDGAGHLVIPQSVTITSSNVVTLGFGAAFTGSVLVITIPTAVRIYQTSWSALTSVSVVHNFGTTVVVVQVSDGSGVNVIPQGVVVTDGNTVTLTFGAAFTGSVIVMG